MLTVVPCPLPDGLRVEMILFYVYRFISFFLILSLIKRSGLLLILLNSFILLVFRGSILVTIVKTSGFYIYTLLLSLSSLYDERLSLRFTVQLHENTWPKK